MKMEDLMLIGGLAGGAYLIYTLLKKPPEEEIKAEITGVEMR